MMGSATWSGQQPDTKAAAMPSAGGQWSGFRANRADLVHGFDGRCRKWLNPVFRLGQPIREKTAREKRFEQVG